MPLEGIPLARFAQVSARDLGVDADGALRITDWKPLKLSGWRGFRVQWVHAEHAPIEPPVFWGIYSFGSRWIAPWADLAYHPSGTCPDCNRVWMLNDAASIALFRIWSEIIPPDGHVAVEYESADHHETMMGLIRQVPPVLTPIGFWAYMGGIVGTIRDWYISEGGHEGPRKLQINQAHDWQHALKIHQAFTRDVETFLARHPDPRDVIIQNAVARGHRWLMESPSVLDRVRDLLKANDAGEAP